MVVNARLTRAALAAAVSLAILPGPALAGGPHPDSTFRPGSAGAGDPYFPLDGNGGYDVTHYDLDLRFDPATDHLDAVATITARATQNLSAFDLDFAGLTVRGVKVDGRSADWRRDDQELVIVPRRGLPKGNVFITRIDYDGTPGPTDDGFGGWFNTEDGASVAGEPHGAATWFPVNDHPSDKASYAIHVTAPKDLEVASNGTLKDRRTTGAWTTWTWVEDAPMAAYLATVTIGQFGVHAYRADGIRFWDFTPDRLAVPLPTPHGGSRYAISQVGMPSYKRLTRSIAVPPGGANLSFWVAGQTEFPWDFGVVEAHTAGSDADWTTLRDLNGHNAADTGASCPYWLPIHPFLEHYETDNGDDTCAPSGTTGDWWGETGQRDGWEQWDVDLSPWAGKTAEVSITYASDDLVQREGLFVDDIVSSTGVGSTGFEADGDVMDGWTVSGAPAGSEPNPNDWIVGTAADAPPTIADLIAESFSHQPAILAFESRTFGSYPFTTGGGIVVNTDDIGFALETQTRPTYALHYWTDREVSDDVLVHELAHQWFGDTVSVGRWQDIWLNEGFASYAQWLWSEDQGSDSAQDIFDFFYDVHPADDPFWTLVVADPGPAQLFDRPVYVRGAMTLHQLRLDVGDDAFFRILRQWVKTRGGGSGTTPQFIALAERISGHDLDALVQTWLFTPTKPVVGSLMTSLAGRAADLRHAPSPAVDGIERFGVGTRAASPRR